MKHVLLVAGLLLSGVSAASEYVVAPILRLHPLIGDNYFAVETRVYRLPDMQIVARSDQIDGLVATSTSGAQLYELDVAALRARTYQLPSLQLIHDVPVQGDRVYFDPYTWMSENPRRPGIVMLGGLVWIDFRSGAIVENPDTLEVPRSRYGYSIHTALVHDARTLVISDHDPASVAPYVKLVDLEDPRKQRTMPYLSGYGTLVAGRGRIVIEDENAVAIKVLELGSEQVLDTIALPPAFGIQAIRHRSAIPKSC